MALKNGPFHIVEIDEGATERWAVVMRYPLYLETKLLTDIPGITAATRCQGQDKTPTAQVKVTVQGKVPDSVTVGLFGTFQVRKWNAEPMRCYRCNRFGHHQRVCQGRITCGVCAGRHATEECMEKHRQGQHVQAKCPNCTRPHHAWNPRCPERVKRVPPRTQPATTGTRPPRQVTPTQRTTSRSRSRSRPTSRPKPRPNPPPRPAPPPATPPSQQGWNTVEVETEVHPEPSRGVWPILPAPRASYRDALTTQRPQQQPPKQQRNLRPRQQQTTVTTSTPLPARPRLAPTPIIAAVSLPPTTPTTLPPRQEPPQVETEEEIYSQLEVRMTVRQQAFERQLDRYSQSLQDMQSQVTTIQHQLLDMLKLQFNKLASVITDTLQLPSDQADIIRDLVDDHLHQLAVTAQLQPPQGPFRMTSMTHSTYPGATAAETTTPRQVNRDTRPSQHVPRRTR